MTKEEKAKLEKQPSQTTNITPNYVTFFPPVKKLTKEELTEILRKMENLK